ISFYDDMRPALVDTVNEGIKYVDQLADAFDSGGLQGVVRAAGDIFAELAVNVANKAPEMVSAAIGFIQAFGSGISSNKGKIYDAAVDIASTLGTGLASLLPKSVSEPATKAVEELAKSFKSGGIKDAVKTVSNMFEKFGDAAGKVAKVTLPVVTKAIDLLGSNLDILVPVVAAGAAAFKGYTIVQNVSKWFKTASAASVAYAAAMTASTTATSASSAASILLASTMSATEIIVGVLTGKVTLATAAQVAWNAVLNANPIGIVITAVAALVGGLAIYTNITSEAAEETYKLTEEQQKNVDACNEAAQKLRDLNDAHAEAVTAIDREYDKYGALKEELKSITDENGKIKEGYKERAAVITNQLAEALGVEISMTDDVIDNYGEVLSVLDQVIVKKKAEAILSSMQDDMTKAYDNTMETMEKYKATASDVEAKEKDLAEAKEAVVEADARYKDALATDWAIADAYEDKLIDAVAAEEAATAARDEAVASMKEVESELSDLATAVDNYYALYEAAMSGDVAKIESAMNTLITSYKSFTAESLEESGTARQEMLSQAQGYVDSMKLVQDGTLEVADDVYNTMSGAALNSILEFNKMPGGIATAIGELGPEASAAMASALSQADLSGKLDAEAKESIECFIGGFSELDAKTQEVWSQAWYGALAGLEGFENLADPATEGVDAFLESLRTALEVHSPSKAVQEIFSNVWPGAEAGLDEGQEGALSKGEGFISTFLGLFTNAQLGEAAKSAGQSIMDFFGIGVSEKTENSKSAGRANAQAASDGAGSVNPTDKGSVFGTLFGGGITGKIGDAKTKGTGLANSAKTGAGSVNSTSTGTKFGSQYNTGVGSKAGESRTKGTSLANNANTGAKSVTGRSAGEGFGSGFVSGIAAWISSAASKAAQLASSALAAAKKALASNSPSKKTIRMGKDFDKGFEIGMDEDADKVEQSAENLSNAALDAIDTEALQEKLQALDIASEMDKLYAAVDSQHRILSDNVTQELVVKVEQDAKDNTVKLSDNDLTTLYTLINKIADRPVLAQAF
ncbi:MAG: hypothetical protein ACRDBM_10480, partial [Sporomusa sp.]